MNPSESKMPLPLGETGLRTRNRGLQWVRVADLVVPEWNINDHPTEQQEALTGAVTEFGFYGYPDVWVMDSGELCLFDGVLRRGDLIDHYGPDTLIQVNVTDFDEAGAKAANLTKDAITKMSKVNPVNLAELLKVVNVGDEALQKLAGDMADAAGLFRTDPGCPIDDSPPLTLELECKCPKCGHTWNQADTPPDEGASNEPGQQE